MAELPDKRLADGPMPAPELRGDMAADAWEFAQSTAQKGPATIRVESPPQAFIDGAKAYTAGKPLHANSFSTHPDRGCADSESDPYLAWEDGWKMARAIDRRQQAERAAIRPINEATMVPTPYRQGGQAFFDGLPIGANPFVVEPSKREWHRGWQSAKDLGDNEAKADGPPTSNGH